MSGVISGHATQPTVMSLSATELEKIDQLRHKYALSGQDLISYLEGLLHSRYLTYWDYLQLDTLLSLQTPRTEYPDEMIFICYHQITELYFKLIHLELDQLLADKPAIDNWTLRLRRTVAYFRQLVTSFDTMVDGMAPAQFLQFRMALLPASGFQSVQYRQIELKLTSLARLAAQGQNALTQGTVAQLYPLIYWKQGNRNAATGEKTLTLEMFEQRYDSSLQALAEQHQHSNLHAQWLANPHLHTPELSALLRDLDLYANVFWRLAHYKSAVRYLQRDPEDIKATGGTNWQQYLPPRFQRVIFFPDVWSDEERAEWGKAWVAELFKQRVESGWRSSLPADQPQVNP